MQNRVAANYSAEDTDPLGQKTYRVSLEKRSKLTARKQAIAKLLNSSADCDRRSI